MIKKDQTNLCIVLIDECREDQLIIRKALSRFDNITFHSFYNIAESVKCFNDDVKSEEYFFPDLFIIDNIRDKNTFDSLKCFDNSRSGLRSLFVLMHTNVEMNVHYDYLRVNTFEKPQCFSTLRGLLEVIVEKEMIGKEQIQKNFSRV